jgi:hypothetical protein
VKHYKHVIATDPSPGQINNAIQHPAISYHIEASESESNTVPDGQVDLIVVATALHWFNFPSFYDKVNRVAKTNAQSVLATWCYSLCELETPQLNSLLKHFYVNIIGSYWEPQRRYVDEEYNTIPWPDYVIPIDKNGKEVVDRKRTVIQEFFCERELTVDHFEGYLTSWSSTQTFTEKHDGKSPLYVEAEWRDMFRSAWNEGQEGKTRRVVYPINLLVGRIDK